MFLDIFVLMYFGSNKCSLGEHKILLNDGLLQWTLMSQQFLLQSIAMFCYSNAMHGIIWDFCVCEFLPCVVLGSLAVLVQCSLCFSWYRGFQLLMLCVCVCVCVCVCGCVCVGVCVCVCDSINAGRDSLVFQSLYYSLSLPLCSKFRCIISS